MPVLLLKTFHCFPFALDMSKLFNITLKNHLWLAFASLISQYIFFLTLVLNNIDLPFIWVQFQLIPAWCFSFSIEHSLTTHHSSPFTWTISFLSLHIVMNMQLSQEKLPLLLDLVSSTRLHTPLTQQLSSVVHGSLEVWGPFGEVFKFKVILG